MEINFLGTKLYIKKFVLVAAALALAALTGISAYILSRENSAMVINKNSGQASEDKDTHTDTTNAQDGNKVESTRLKSDEETIQIYIVGCIKKEGVVEIRKGQLIADAVQAAGGFTEDADTRNINMVYKLNENVMLCIKSKNETQNADNTKTFQPVQDSQANEAGKGAEIQKTDGGVIVNNLSQSGSAGGKVNINSASAEQMDTLLPGVGPSTAKDIVTYREKNGQFKTIEDIMKVPGIKENKFNKLKELITVN